MRYEFVLTIKLLVIDDIVEIEMKIKGQGNDIGTSLYIGVKYAVYTKEIIPTGTKNHQEFFPSVHCSVTHSILRIYIKAYK